MEIAASNNTVTIGEPIEVTVSASATNGCNGLKHRHRLWIRRTVITINGSAPQSDYGPGTYTVVATVLMESANELYSNNHSNDWL
jgi:hypothetical protein